MEEEALLDLGPAGGEPSQHRSVDPLDLGGSAVDGTEGDTEGLDQAGPERRLVDEACGPGVGIEPAGIGGRPAAVLAQHGIGGKDVGVKLGVAVARGAVDEGGAHQHSGCDPAQAVGAPAGEEGGRSR